jgi:hypothetical protein
MPKTLPVIAPLQVMVGAILSLGQMADKLGLVFNILTRDQISSNRLDGECFA